MKQKKIFFLLAAVLIIFAGFWFAYKADEPEKNLDAFAACIAQKGLTMYGAAWCTHCQNQKKDFGESFRLVPYVECPDNPKLCTEKGVEGYPTWLLPDGRKLVGEQSLQNLAAVSGCSLPS